jgi:pimeloyl-ACP methyl ester carboxylesterase
MLEPTLSQLKQRILIIWGTGDKLLGARGGLKLQAAIPDARLIELERCGHCAHEEYPERFNAILSAFIGH